MSRARRHVELPEYLAACRRMLRGAGRRVGDADPEDLAALLALRADLDAVIDDAVVAMRQPLTNGQPGYSWADLAAALGTSRQAVQQRYGKRAVQVTVPGQVTVDEAIAEATR